jgi:sugar transferase (PEP-CTERM system associated)
MVRLFHVYYPVRTLVLFACEALIVCVSFLAALVLRMGSDSYLVLNYEAGWIKIITVTLLALLCSYYFDLYSPQRLASAGEVYFRLLMVLGILAFLLAGIGYLFPSFMFANDVFLFGLVILTIGLLMWRRVFTWMIRQPYLQERVYVIGAGERARTLVESIRSRSDLGMEVVGWAGAVANGSCQPESFAAGMCFLGARRQIDRIIVAMPDRRGTMPVRELLNARLNGIRVEDASSLLEKINGKIELEDLYPSSLIFSEGFRLNHTFLLLRRVLSFGIALLALIICLPLIPIVALAVKWSSPGPVLFRQQRVGLKGRVFTLSKFRTMRQDAEAETGAVWACKDDPRVTSIGRILRKTRLDEIPQLWNVLIGDMGFVGPRPERPQFVQQLSENIPYYHLRHIIRPGVTGWAQVSYQYGASVEESKQKLQYDLYYIKHMSVALDLLIMFETIKTILLRRGAQ